MLRLILVQPNGSLLGSAEIGNVSGGACSDYEVTVFDSRVDLLGTGSVDRYARWSAPVYDLVLRCLCSALFGAEDRLSGRAVPEASVPGELEARIELVPGGRAGSRRVLMSWRFERAENGIVCAVLDHETARAELKVLRGWSPWQTNAWLLVLQTWCMQLWGKPEVGPRFPALEVPLHGEPGHQYVRMRDIPAHARATFEKRMSGRTRPYIEGVADAVFPWDWTDFLAGWR